MPAPRKIGVLIGSLRKESFTRKTAKALIEVAPKHLSFEIIEIGGISSYNPDRETDTPPDDWTALRAKIKSMDAILFATPEYNRSIPGALKNAIDVASRPSGQSAFKGKPAMVMSVSTGVLSGFGANHHLRQSLVSLDLPTLQQPEIYIGGVAKLFGEGGQLINDGTRELLAKGAQAFSDWVELILRN